MADNCRHDVLCLPLFFLFFCRHLGLDLVPRKDFEVVDSDQISVSDLYKMVRNLWEIPLSFHTGRERRGK